MAISYDTAATATATTAAILYGIAATATTAAISYGIAATTATNTAMP